MTPYDISFLVLAGTLLASAVGVISVRNPIHAVLLLVLTFFNAGGLFVLLGAEFLAMLLVIVYIGAVMVLFLFVVMMLSIKPKEKQKPSGGSLSFAILIAGILMFELGGIALSFHVLDGASAPISPIADGVTNTKALGMVMYTDYIYPFQAAGLILLVAMIGAIVLTHRKRNGVLTQSISDQVSRDPKDVLEVHKVESRTGA